MVEGPRRSPTSPSRPPPSPWAAFSAPAGLRRPRSGGPSREVPAWRIPFPDRPGPASVATSPRRSGRPFAPGAARAPTARSHAKSSLLGCKTQSGNQKNNVAGPGFLHGDTLSAPPHSREASFPAGHWLGTNGPQRCQPPGRLLNPVVSAVAARKGLRPQKPWAAWAPSTWSHWCARCAVFPNKSN